MVTLWDPKIKDHVKHAQTFDLWKLWAIIYFSVLYIVKLVAIFLHSNQQKNTTLIFLSYKNISQRCLPISLKILGLIFHFVRVILILTLNYFILTLVDILKETNAPYLQKSANM